MARCCDRRHVIEIGVSEERPVACEAAKSIVAEQIPETLYEVIAELVNHNHHYKLRRETEGEAAPVFEQARLRETNSTTGKQALRKMRAI